MRKIQKSSTEPVSLKGLKAPKVSDTIDRNKYNGRDVKEQLCKDQYSKCIYCECKLNGDYGHIEHFRPKGGYTIYPNNKPLYTPGYYWLAYKWSNLLLSCSICNSSYKQNHFNLESESQRNIARRSIVREIPLLINPSVEDPGFFIEFHQHIVVPRLKDGTESRKGRYTLELLKLNDRIDLVKNRRSVWESFIRWRGIKTLAQKMILLGTNIDYAEKMLELANESISKMKAPESEYSAMFLYNNALDSH